MSANKSPILASYLRGRSRTRRPSQPQMRTSLCQALLAKLDNLTFLLRPIVMLPNHSSLRCLALGLLVTLAQVGLVVSFAKPVGSLGHRYLALVQHDSYWFANIINRGYGTTLRRLITKRWKSPT
jgi:hypothetical protein